MANTTSTMTPKVHSPSRENRSAGTPSGPIPEETMQVGEITKGASNSQIVSFSDEI